MRALLGAIGLVMAYTNSVEAGQSVFDGSAIFSRALMWSALAIVVFTIVTAFDYRWLKTLAWPIYGINLGLLVLTLAIGDGVGGSARWVNIGPLTFQFSELAKILMIIVLATYLGNREGRLDSLTSILGACLLMAPAVLLVMMQPDLGSSLVLGLDPRRDAVHVRGQPALAAGDGRWRPGGDPDRLDVRPPGLPEGADPHVPQPDAPTRRDPGGR